VSTSTSTAPKLGSKPTVKKGTRPKHVPQRTCIACRQKDAKRSYVRLVRTPELRVEVDPTGKRNGRGAYLCPRRGCWQRALDSRAIDHALKVQLDEANRAALNEYARSYFPPDEAT
jgi:predicted RNA-binding protein YlxR (DUF448 family)